VTEPFDVGGAARLLDDVAPRKSAADVAVVGLSVVVGEDTTIAECPSMPKRNLVAALVHDALQARDETDDKVPLGDVLGGISMAELLNEPDPPDEWRKDGTALVHVATGYRVERPRGAVDALDTVAHVASKGFATVAAIEELARRFTGTFAQRRRRTKAKK
jgi:hypothetical protein